MQHTVHRYTNEKILKKKSINKTALTKQLCGSIEFKNVTVHLKVTSIFRREILNQTEQKNVISLFFASNTGSGDYSKNESLNDFNKS